MSLDKASINWSMPDRRRLDFQLAQKRAEKHRGIPVLNQKGEPSSIELAEAEIDAIIEKRQSSQAQQAWERFFEEQVESSSED